MASEGRSRLKKEELIGPAKLTADMMPLIVTGEDSHSPVLSPVVYVENVKDYILHTLDELDRFVYF